jgi:hypothetical protein
VLRKGRFEKERDLRREGALGREEPSSRSVDTLKREGRQEVAAGVGEAREGLSGMGGDGGAFSNLMRGARLEGAAHRWEREVPGEVKAQESTGHAGA